MRRSTAARRWAIVAAAAIGATLTGAAEAQAYRCRYGDTVVPSSQPCAGTHAGRPSGNLGAYGNTQHRPSSRSPCVPGAPRAEEHVGYLGVECAERQRLYDKEAREGEQRRSEKIADREAGIKAAAEDEQCHELLRILPAKRQRAASMVEGQRADVQRSEAAYQERCKRG
jgi:hypothetical protein